MYVGVSVRDTEPLVNFLSITKYSLCVSKLLSMRQCQFSTLPQAYTFFAKVFQLRFSNHTFSFLPKHLPRDKTKLDLYLFSKSMETNSK